MNRLDIFSQRQFEDLARRWIAAQREHHVREREMWAGTVALAFNDHELRILSQGGFVSPGELELFAQIRHARILEQQR